MFAKGFTRKKRTLHCYAQCKVLWATLHKARLAALYAICLQIFRYLAQKLLEIRKYSCVVSIQSNEKSDYASYAQSLCNVAHIYTKKCVPTRKTHFVKSVIFYLGSVALNEYNRAVCLIICGTVAVTVFCKEVIIQEACILSSVFI